jgi:hypothetical protein
MEQIASGDMPNQPEENPVFFSPLPLLSLWSSIPALSDFELCLLLVSLLLLLFSLAA